jgi:hypothetical protein
VLQAIILKSQVAGAVKQFEAAPAAKKPAAPAAQTEAQSKKPGARERARA